MRWIRYDPEEGEIIEFCCDDMKREYGISIGWDEGSKSWCKREKRKTYYQDPYTSKMIFKIVEGVEDLTPIEKCPYCEASME